MARATESRSAGGATSPIGDGGSPIAPAIDLGRYRKLRRFLAETVLRTLWWDVFLRQPVLRRFRRPALPRWQEVARKYRELAVELGGVLIKLGQFLSIRVDVLPREITAVLADLQDEVAPVPFTAIRKGIEEDLGRRLEQTFSAISPDPLGSASLAQVHAARLADGREVVVKALRPGIEVLVETDFAALRLAARWLELWKPIRRRVDVSRLVKEFEATTRAELDLEQEGRNARRLAENFADRHGVRFPAIVPETSGPRTLTMENVAAIKITAVGELERAGIAPARVAARLYDLYLTQIFVHHFVHADPHPGNLFVHPLPGATAAGSPEDVAFEVAFVDCGMVAEVPPRLREALRELIVGLGTRDARRVVDGYARAGVLLPGADIERLVEVHEELFERFWGMKLGEMRAEAMSQVPYFLRHYWDLIAELPFQAPVELIFVGRALGMLQGLATSLDPEFDPNTAIGPFVERLTRDASAAAGWSGQLLELVQRLVRLPARAERTLERLERGDLAVRAALATDARRAVDRLERATRRTNRLVLGTGLLVATVLLRPGIPQPWGWLLVAGAGLVLLWGVLRR